MSDVPTTPRAGHAAVPRQAAGREGGLSGSDSERASDAGGPRSPTADAARLAFADWRAGDEAGLERLIRLLTPLLWQLARAYRLDEASAEDAVQMTWLALVRHRDQVRDPQAVLRWLSVTVRREAARAARTSGKAPPVQDEVIDAALDPAPGVEAEVMERQTRDVLWRHVRELSERCQRLLRVLAFSDRPDYQSLSSELGMPVGSIGPTRGRCLDKLRAACAADPAWGTP